jgi:hypothetical protein
MAKRRTDDTSVLVAMVLSVLFLLTMVLSVLLVLAMVLSVLLLAMEGQTIP